MCIVLSGQVGGAAGERRCMSGRLERVFTGTQKRARLPLLMLVGIVGEFGCVLRTCLVGY